MIKKILYAATLSLTVGCYSTPNVPKPRIQENCTFQEPQTLEEKIEPTKQPKKQRKPRQPKKEPIDLGYILWGLYTVAAFSAYGLEKKFTA